MMHWNGSSEACHVKQVHDACEWRHEGCHHDCIQACHHDCLSMVPARGRVKQQSQGQASISLAHLLDLIRPGTRAGSRLWVGAAAAPLPEVVEGCGGCCKHTGMWSKRRRVRGDLLGPLHQHQQHQQQHTYSRHSRRLWGVLQWRGQGDASMNQVIGQRYKGVIRATITREQ
eukprot:scaffold3930_cov21-Tisochrysis_lutea.AAC.2